MFTGIVDHQGKILKREETLRGLRLFIETRFTNLTLGESIAVDGACLTVTDFKDGEFTCELSPETLELTVSRSYERGTKVNLERALRVGDALGGHWVLGHVDGKASVSLVEKGDEFWRVGFHEVGEAFAKYLAPKGSVTVNGVSLTVNQVLDDGFEVMLIPHTLERTNLKELFVGAWVNLEFDYLAKLVIQKMEQYKGIHAERF